MIALLFAAQWIHLTLCVLLTGSLCLLLLAGQPPTAFTRQWEQRVLRWACFTVAGALLSGVVVMATETALFEGRPAAALEPHAILRATLDTRLGLVWMARQGLLFVLAVFLVLSRDADAGANWIAARAQAFLMAAFALALTRKLKPPHGDVGKPVGPGRRPVASGGRGRLGWGAPAARAPSVASRPENNGSGSLRGARSAALFPRLALHGGGSGGFWRRERLAACRRRGRVGRNDTTACSCSPSSASSCWLFSWPLKHLRCCPRSRAGPVQGRPRPRGAWRGLLRSKQVSRSSARPCHRDDDGDARASQRSRLAMGRSTLV